MFHSFVYPDEAYDENTENKLSSNFCPVTMINGRIDFIEPKDCKIKHQLGTYKIKPFDHTNFMSVDELLDIYEKEGVSASEPNECSS